MDIINNLVICGGGSKGFLILGLLQKLHENNILANIENYCGTSVGAIISLLLLIGYEPMELFYVTYKINIDDLLNINFKSLINTFGLYSNEPILYVVKSLMKEKKVKINITFKQLKEKFNKTLAISGVCLNDNSLHFFDHNTHPDMPIIHAIKISISIPLMFESVIYNNKTWVDGACICNYPLEYFKDNLEQTIGICLKYDKTTYDSFDSIKDYIVQLMKCLIKDDSNHIQHNKTIYLQYKTIGFTINNDVKIDMYNIGYKTPIDNFITNII